MTPELLLTLMYAGQRPARSSTRWRRWRLRAARDFIVANAGASFTGEGLADLWRLRDLMRRLKRREVSTDRTRRIGYPIEMRPGLCYVHGVTAFDRLPDLLRALNAESVDYVLFGGQAVNLHGILRFTDDIDLFVSPTPDNVERLRCALRRVWADPAIDEVRAEDLAGGIRRGPIRYP